MSATIASAMGTARRPTHGSWRPVVLRRVCSNFLVRVRLVIAMELVGLKVILTIK